MYGASLGVRVWVFGCRSVSGFGCLGVVGCPGLCVWASLGVRVWVFGRRWVSAFRCLGCRLVSGFVLEFERSVSTRVREFGMSVGARDFLDGASGA